MKVQHLSILAVFFATVPAFAGQALNVGDVRQVQAGSQASANALYLNVDAPLFLRAGQGGGVDQSATNVSNLLQAKAYTIQSVDQTMRGSQTVTNRYVDNAARRMESLAQSGENLANVVTADRIVNVAQYLGDDASQSVFNTIAQASRIAAVNQSGTNMANVAYADVSIGSGTQVFPTGASQSVRNVVAPVSGGVGALSQTGQNMGNVLVADRVENVSRTFTGTQTIDNIFLNAPGARLPNSIEQSGLNVANYISANSVDNVTQISAGTQTVTNTAYDSSLGKLTASTPGISSFSQSTANFVNLTEINQSGSSEQPVSLTQTADMPQTASGAGSQTQVANMATISR